MLVKIGKRDVSTDAVGLLLECHERIRKFLAMARTLAAARGVPADELRGVAGQVRRYFAESLPLHIADEHEALAPRLAGSGAEVAAALARMDADHDDHAPHVTHLVALCDELVRDPGRLPAVADELAAVANRLTDELGSHLELEERVIFPALRKLPARELDAIRVAMRERRES